MTSLPSVPAEVTRDSIQQLLPTCQRCKRLRRKCDTQLPSCRVCEKAGAECTLFDHALQQVLPRRYVQSLLRRVEHLEAVKNGVPLPLFAEGVVQPPTPKQDDRSPQPSASTPTPSFDVVIPSTSTEGKSRHWGSSSVFVLTVEILQHAVSRGLISHEDAVGDCEAEQSHVDDQFPYAQIQAPDADIQFLVDLYLVSLNTMYGFVDEAETAADLRTYLALRQQPDFSPRSLHGTQAYQYFRITMMCAISCANRARYRPQRAAECFAYYSGAVACIEEVTSEASAASLQALLLLIVFCLFHPRKGDIWKLLDYACRLAIELGYHTEVEQEQVVSTEAETKAQRKRRRSTFWGLYAIERIVGQLFGRGSDLPEAIITTEYPDTLQIAVAAGISPASESGVDQVTLQSMSIAHHYRLVYLRSEIYRVMYLPASPPDLGLDWLKEKYASLYAWRRELAVTDDMAGVATLTCDVGYDATICFLFQPLLLKALRSTMKQPAGDQQVQAGTPSSTESCDLFVASDPFYSAVNLIRTYEKIIRAPEQSNLGQYPMTFMSAHYIYLATSTLLAHAVLRLDGRTKMLGRMFGGSGATEVDAEEIDWGIFVDISSSCLVLLSWCGERWPGMLGMLGVYQKLLRRALRELIRKGIVV
ncbi:hypothetical protein GQ53DRAFT_719125 [Thozetella sp. PMI_491]|nr:hypothetical protein GQ53DRAFT_719125 [Thozetella sp. PMI_491]